MAVMIDLKFSGVVSFKIIRYRALIKKMLKIVIITTTNRNGRIIQKPSMTTKAMHPGSDRGINSKLNRMPICNNLASKKVLSDTGLGKIIRLSLVSINMLEKSEIKVMHSMKMNRVVYMVSLVRESCPTTNEKSNINPIKKKPNMVLKVVLLASVCLWVFFCL